MRDRTIGIPLLCACFLVFPSAARGDALADGERACAEAKDLWDRNRPDDAGRRLETALRACSGDARCETRVRLALAELAVVRGDRSRAAECRQLAARLRGHPPAEQAAQRCTALATKPAAPKPLAAVPLAKVARIHEEAERHAAQSEADAALGKLDEAVRVAQQEKHAPSEALTLSSRGHVLAKSGRREAGIRDLDRAATLYRQLGDPRGEAKALRSAGNARLALGRPGEALAAFRDAVPLQRAAGSRRGEAAALSGLSATLVDDAPAAAAFVGKLAVRAYASDPSIRLRQPVVEAHRRPAEAMLAANRPGEAIAMLARLERIRLAGTRGTPPLVGLPPIELSKREVEIAREYDRLVSSVASAERAYAAVLMSAATGGASPEALEAARRKREEARERFKAFMERMKRDVGADDALAARRLTSIQTTLADLGAGTAAVLTFVGPKRVWTILITPDSVSGHSARIDREDLHARVKAFRAALQDTRVDPREPAAAMYDVLVKPIRAEMDERNVTTVMWWLDDWLRYVPPQALWDPIRQQWFVERASSTVFNLSSLVQLTAARPDTWSVLAAGVSRPFGDLAALSGVPGELAAIAREADGEPGVLAGRRLLDGQFTRATLEAALVEGRPVVHIASHYVFDPPVPADDADDDAAEEEAGPAAPSHRPSYLLLGDGSSFTIDDLDALPAAAMRKIDLLALSACETGIGLDAADPTAALEEIDGFASTAQERGVRAVLASLWRVSDASTPALMRAFYAARGGKDGMSKAEALRAAELDMLRGKIAPADGLAEHACGARGVLVEEAPLPMASWTHPCHWAPFLIAGNWR